MKNKVKQHFQTHAAAIREEILALLGEMVAQKTVNVISEKLPEFPYLSFRGEEYRVAQIVKREFDRWGIGYVTHQRQEGRPNVIGTIGAGKIPKTLFMACHMDIVPPGEGWETDPFVITVKEGKAYGRGVLDNKGPLISSMIAARVLKEVVGEANLPGRLQVAALADEEATDPDGIDYGIGYLLEEKLIDPTYAIIPDIGENMRKIDVAEKGRVVLKITSLGKQAHGSTPDLGVNAIYPMAQLLGQVEKLKFDYTPDPFVGHPTLNLGEIHGGAAPNIVPGKCVAFLDIRLVPGQTPEAVAKQIRGLAAQIRGDFTVELSSATAPHAVDPNNVLVQAIQRNAAEHLGFRPVPFGLGGGTFAKTLNQCGVIAVGFGPGDDTAFHVANEFVELAQLLQFAELICLVALDLVS